MSKVRFMLSCAVLLALLSGAGPINAAGAFADATARMIVSFDQAGGRTASFASVRTSKRLALLDQFQSRVKFSPQRSGFIVIELTQDEAKVLAEDSTIFSIVPDGVVHVSGDPVDSSEVPVSWGLDRIDQPELPLDNSFSSASDGAGVDVYILDTGVDSTHPAFGGRVMSGQNFADDGFLATQDPDGHGTHVAGTVAGSAYGLARSARIIPVRVLNSAGWGYWSWIMAGFDWVAVQSGITGRPSVANASIGGGYYSLVNDKVNSAVGAGVTVVVAAGNENQNACNTSPASAPNAITVGATSPSDYRAGFSNWGSCLDIFAPGVDINSSLPLGSSGLLSGTSMASPHVAGAAALLLEEHPDATPAEVLAMMVQDSPSNVVFDTKGSVNRLLNIGTLSTEVPISEGDTEIMGTPLAGTIVEINLGPWSGNPEPTVVYQWWQCDREFRAGRVDTRRCRIIPGAEEPEFAPTTTLVGKRLRLVETASNSSGAATRYSATSAPVAAPPLISNVITLRGTPRVGRNVAANIPKVNGTQPLNSIFQWFACTEPALPGTTVPTPCAPIVGANKPSLRVTAEVSGKRLLFGLSVSNEYGSAESYSATSSVVP